MNEELKAILEKAYASGKSIDEVSAAMRKNGYADDDIAFASNFYGSKKKKTYQFGITIHYGSRAFFFGLTSS